MLLKAFGNMHRR